MVQINPNWLRNIELLSLTISVIGWPVIAFSLAILSWYVLLPPSPIPDVIYLLIILLLFFGITMDTRYGIIGVTLVQPFKNYLKHSETKADRNTARFSFLNVFFLDALYYGLVLTILATLSQ